MNPKYLLTVALIVGATGAAFAQYSQDALRFSSFQTGSSARIKAVGNAGTAIGGDMTAIGGNPAGLGFFTRSEFSFTPEFDGSKVNSTYQGTNNSASKSSLNLSNVGAVFYGRLNTPKGTDKSKGWLSLNFGISYNRTNNYYEDVKYGGTNKTNSITDYYASDANTNNRADGTLGQWAYNANLIDSYANGTGTIYKSNATTPEAVTNANINPNGFAQVSDAIRTGGQSELSLAMGGNYSNKFYFGLGIGITNIRYNSNATFTENGIASVITATTPALTYARQPFANSFMQDQETTGAGFNAKLGFIYKPVDAVRFGAAITSPTWYTIHDDYNESMYTRLNGTSSFNGGPADYKFTYTLRTPTRVSGGLAIFIQQYGFITGDVEYLDYSSAHLEGDYQYTADNKDIKTLYKSAVNAHVGAEARLTSEVSLRGGYGVQGNALKANGSDINTISGGLGYRAGDYYIDATYQHITGAKSIVYPYEVGTASPSAQLTKTFDNVFVTVGFRF
jgi:hypothetical protein